MIRPIAGSHEVSVSIVDGNLRVKFGRGATYELSRPVALELLERLEVLLRPVLFQIEEEKEELDLSEWVDPVLNL